MAGAKPPFEDLYRDYLNRIYAYVRAQVGAAAEAEDVTAQAFMNAYRAYDRFQPLAETPSAWLFRIARNAALDHHRRAQVQARVGRALAAEPEPSADPAALAEERIRYRDLMAIVATLPERQREVVSLRHAGGFSFREVGELMGCTEDAAKMLHHRALRALRARLAESVP
ncbi:MAG: RNA polymerase sigma factor [Candidatus Dormibacteraceae bacterium]